MDQPNTPSSTADRIAPIAVAVAACLATVAIGLAVLGGHTSGRGDAGSAAGSAAVPAASEAAQELAKPADPAVTYTWSNEVPAEYGLELGEGSFEAWHPVFASDTSSEEAIAAINADALAQVADAVDTYNGLIAWKSWGSASLLPAVTLLTDEYVAVHYYHVYDAGTTGTLSVAGQGALYRLSDGARVSPSEMLGIGEAELLSMAQSALDRWNSLNTFSYEDSLENMLASGYLASYVVLPDGVYLYVCGAARHRPGLGYHLVRVCDLAGGDEGFDGMVYDLYSFPFFSRYENLSREGTFSEPNAPTEDPVQSYADDTLPMGLSEAEQEQPRADAEARGLQVFEGTVRILSGEETAALSGLDIYVNGDYGAELELNKQYAFVLLDDVVTVDVTMDPMDGPRPQEANRFLIGDVLLGGGDLTTDTVSQYQPYNRRHVCVAAADFTRGDDLNIYQAPCPNQFEILYVAD